MDETPVYPHIPYGQSDFRRIGLNRWLYVDKTRFLRRLEQEHYAFLIRPRRFGKSLWVSLLENYYDRFWAGDFDATFAGTDIGRDPTEERSRYVTLRFDFSTVNDKLETLEREFEAYCLIELEGTLERHPDLFPEAARQRILAPPSIATKLSMLFRYTGDHDIPLYVLIDEYDNFANTVLAYHGAEAYESFTHGGGFYRNFFATLKSGTSRSGGGIDRLFITGVSPVTMDDVTSGFNIGTNISLHPDFNEMVGFTEAEVRRLVEIYRARGVFDQDAGTAMGIMAEWYNGYRFATGAKTDLYNTDMVLYYLKHSIPNRGVPEYLIDTNVRIDYGKLRHLLVVGRQPRPNGNFDLLRNIIADERVDVLRIQPSFPLNQLTDEENFLSLLHYFGLLSIREVAGATPRLGIPNQTVKRLMYGYLRDAYRDVEVFRISLFRFEQLLMRMANEGEWRPALEFLGEAIARQTGIRDYIAGEKVIQGFLAAYLSLADYYVFRSEAELGKGHADITLEPLVARYPQLRRGYLIELKYLSRGESVEPGRVAAAAGAASAQLERYLADERLARQFPGVRFTGVAVVFHGWEMVFCDAVA